MKALLVALLLTRLAWPQADSFLERGNGKLKEHDYGAALTEYRAGLGLEPMHPLLLYNAGLAAFFHNQPRLAIGFWTRYREAQPDDYQGLTKLTQAQEAVDNTVAVERLIGELRELWKSGRDPQLSAEKFFVRCQFDHRLRHFMVFERFQFDPAKRDHFWDIEFSRPSSDDTEGVFSLMFDDNATPPRWFLDLRNPTGEQRTVADFLERPSLNLVIQRIQDQFKLS